MGYHASKLNHCSKQTNAYVTTDDHKLYQLYAYKPIQKDLKNYGRLQSNP